MPYAEFNNGNAGLALGEFMLRSQDQAMSLMERAQRMRVAQDDFDMRREEHAANLVTTSLRQDGLRAEIGKSQIDLKEAEARAADLAGIREEYVRVSPLLDRSIAEIQRIKDPVQQNKLLNQLRSQAAVFHRDPALKAVIEGKFAPLRETIAVNEKAGVAQAIADNKAAPNEMIARQKFPGMELRFEVDPSNGVPVFIATGRPDPVMESRAMGLLSIAENEAELKQAMSDPVVNTMLGVPGSKVSELYRTQRAKFKAESQADDQTGAKVGAAAEKKMTEQNERSVPGFDGLAPTKEEAIKFREVASNNLQIIQGVSDIAKLSALPNASTNLPIRAKIETTQAFLVGKLRLPMTGPGAFTDSEREFVKNTIGNPSKIFSLDEVERSKLDELIKRLNADIDTTASGLGLRRAKKASAASGPVSGSRAQALARGASGSP